MQISQSFTDLFIQNVAASLDKQIYLWENIHHSYHWECDLSEGLIYFREDLSFPIQILGRESEENHTWIWAWADKFYNEFPELTKSAEQLKRIGKQLQIPELNTPEIPLSSQVQGHIISAIASGICQANGYYCCAAENDCIFILIQDPNLIRIVEHPLERILSIFPQVLSNYQLSDPKTALIEYLKSYHLDISLSGDKVIGKLSSEGEIEATFEARNLTNLQAKSSQILPKLPSIESIN
jgi:hypothetical protein